MELKAHGTQLATTQLSSDVHGRLYLVIVVQGGALRLPYLSPWTDPHDSICVTHIVYLRWFSRA